MTDKELELIQKRLEYDFDKPELLKQAFTRKSYSEEGKGEHHNEVLEFYGDKVLEFVVMKKLSYFYGEDTQDGKYVSTKTEGQLTDIKKKLICKKMLAHRIDVLGFADYLLMGKGDIGQNAQNIDSVKEDLFEAIIGAVAIDCEWDPEVLEDVLDVMLDIEHYLLNGFDDDKNYVDLVQTWCQKKYKQLPTYEFVKKNSVVLDGGFRVPDVWIDCRLTLPNGKCYVGKGFFKRESRVSAARLAYQYLKEGNELILPFDEVGEPDFERAINQLQELYQKGCIKEPEYRFYESYDDNGNPVWRCECHVEGVTYLWRNSSSKKDGKKRVAYDMICNLYRTGGII